MSVFGRDRGFAVVLLDQLKQLLGLTLWQKTILCADARDWTQAAIVRGQSVDDWACETAESLIACVTWELSKTEVIAKLKNYMRVQQCPVAFSSLLVFL